MERWQEVNVKRWGLSRTELTNLIFSEVINFVEKDRKHSKLDKSAESKFLKYFFPFLAFVLAQT